MLDSSCQFFLRLSNKKWNGLTCFPRLTDQVFPGMGLLSLVSDLSLLGAVGPQLRVEVLKQKFDCSGVSSVVGEIRETQRKLNDSQVPQGRKVYCANSYSNPV